MTTETNTIPDLTRSVLASRKTGERYQYTYWAVDPTTAVPDAHNCTEHVRLSVSFDKGKGYTARLETTQANFANGVHRELIGIGRRVPRVTIATLPAARFSRAKFDAFATLALDTVTATYGANS